MTVQIDDRVSLLQMAQGYAASGQFDQLSVLARQWLVCSGGDANWFLDLGGLLLAAGLLDQAKRSFERAASYDGKDWRPLLNIANVARETGDHDAARMLYERLLHERSQHTVVRRNVLIGLEYDTAVSDAERYRAALAWGEWVQATLGRQCRPPLAPDWRSRSLRVGIVSADVCQHTVGLFLKDVVRYLAHGRLTLFVYSAGAVKDWVTDEIKAGSSFREIAGLSDSELTASIRRDAIDILVDLSGHSAGSRLTAFARRPAPVMVSWLGYFATTGLDCMDAVILDEWHAPPGTEAQFVEPIIRLPGGRFCYQPVPFAPEVAPLPALQRGFVTFGCFNNTAKLNDAVFDLWARVLHATPDSRLVLKWRTFNDEALRRKVTQAFVDRGIAAERLELRGPSFHAEMLQEYGDIDIALDPFPFTGGLTSCEALWMGVPVVTWPRSRVVSRQTFAFLAAIGLPQLAAQSADDYVAIARDLAADRSALAVLRAGLRERMQASPLMDVQGFARRFEDALIGLYQKIAAEEESQAMNAKTVLHVGPGHRANGALLPEAFHSAEWRELRLDIDPANEPDIVGSMLDMGAVADASVDAIYSAHNIEHVYAYEVPQVLAEFLRVLKPDGFLVLTCPDLQAVCALVAEDKLGEPAYQSPAGGISPHDILYGHGEALAHGHHFMAHKCGFTLKTLTQAVHAAGFAVSAGKRRLRGLDLWLVACKSEQPEEALRRLAGMVLPA